MIHKNMLTAFDTFVLADGLPTNKINEPKDEHETTVEIILDEIEAAALTAKYLEDENKRELEALLKDAMTKRKPRRTKEQMAADREEMAADREKKQHDRAVADAKKRNIDKIYEIEAQNAAGRMAFEKYTKRPFLAAPPPVF